MTESTVTYAIAFVQDVQLVCFSIVFVTMYFQDRANRSLRWFALMFVAGFVGALLQFSDAILPVWLSRGISYEGALISYGCLTMCLIEFTGWGRRIRWANVILVAISLPWFIVWSFTGQAALSVSLLDLLLGIQVAIIVWVLLRSTDLETARPQRLMAVFLGIYAVVQLSRAAIYGASWGIPAEFRYTVAKVGGIADVVVLSLLPLTFVWMINRRLSARLHRESLSDPLTGVYNRRGLEAAGLRELARYQRFGQGFAVVLLDIDHFKKLNDSYGHHGGDEVLSGTAALLHGMMRESDTAGRFGGEEFVLLLTGLSQDAAEVMAERLRIAIEMHNFMADQRSAQITASFGITHSLDRKELTWEKMLQEADVAMYTAKRDGRNCVRRYDQANEATQGRSRASTYSVRTTS